ncbi:MAG TPA: NAD(P)H-quinone oxidoreductase [Mycobacteriales bacterium]|nr:NAD(P)H-quinone oxidoreductase [Mycobacteriales bacterium]
MRAIVISTPGGPEVLIPVERPDPEPGTGAVLLDVAATAVNRADLLQRRGLYPPPAGVPTDIPGLECSGRIAALGDGVTGWQVGDEVCALLAGGGYAERVAVPAGQLLTVPKGLSLLTAAALPEAVCTVWSNVFQLARLQPGEVLLVHGGASGIGTTAIQLASRYGARVCCTAGSEPKLARCRELGAELAVSYREEDFVARVREHTDGYGADVVLDIMGAAYLERNVDVLATNGRLVVIGTQGGVRAELDLRVLLGRRGSVTATSLRARPLAEKAAIVAAVQAGAWPAYEAGEARPIIDRVLPLEQAADAHRAVEAGEHIGKIVLTTG